MYRTSDLIDIAVAGAGPCGLAVGLAAKQAGLSCVLFERRCVASSIGHYPTFMTFFSTAERLEIGGIPFTVSGDKPVRREALRYYQRVARHFELDVRQYHTVESIGGEIGDFVLCVNGAAGRREVHARHVVVATGYFDHPNVLNVPGEDLPKVRHGWSEAYPYFQQDVIVVGGGNSAVDAALELHRWNARVTLVHFAPELDAGVKPWVLPDMLGRIRSGEIAVRFSTRVAAITPTTVRLRSEVDGRIEELPNDWVLAMTGYTPRPGLLREAGVNFDAQTGKPMHDPDSMETDVPGLFIAGVISAGNDANKVFIENGRDHGTRIVGRIQRGR